MTEKEQSVEFQSKIVEFLSSKMQGIKDGALQNVERIAVGWSHETWLFDFAYLRNGSREILPLCLRLDPGNALLREMSDLGTQFKVLRCLESTPLKTPKAYWFEPDSNILGSPFVVMEKVEGECPNPWGNKGRAFYKAAAERGQLPVSFTKELAKLHRLNWQEAGLSFLGVPESGSDFVLSEIRKWERLIDMADRPREPVLEDLIGWLKTNIPQRDEITLVHGAYRTGNLLIKDDGVSAVLDWELQVLGDPMYDVAYVLSDLNREGTDLLSNLVPKEVFYEVYQSESGFDIDEKSCEYYNKLYAMRSCAFWMSAASLYESGASTDLRLARTAWSVPVVLDRAARDLGY